MSFWRRGRVRMHLGMCRHYRAYLHQMKTQNLQAFVSEYYGKLLASSADLKTNACCASGAPPAWIAARLANVHPDVANRFYGCGFPIPHGLGEKTVIDLGCGTGRDVYVLAQLVGPEGHVHGIDMTAEQLTLARDTARWHADRFGYPRANTSFHQGYIEDLRSVGIADASVDVVVSNCVVNLSPRKDLVLAEVFRVLAPGGELYISDVLADRRLPADVATDPVLYAECLGGALYQRGLRPVRHLPRRDRRRRVVVLARRSPRLRAGAARAGVCQHCRDAVEHALRPLVRGARQPHYALRPLPVRTNHGRVPVSEHRAGRRRCLLLRRAESRGNQAMSRSVKPSMALRRRPAARPWPR